MIWAYLFVIVAGAASTALSGSNATMAKMVGQPIVAGLVIQLITIVGLLAVGRYQGMRWPEPDWWGQLPWWAWLGGFGGATILLSQLYVAQQVGAAPYLAITVTAGVVVSIAMDHWGLVGFEQVRAQGGRLAGGALMIGGVILVARN